MKDIVLIVIHLAVTAGKLLGPGGVRALVAENLVLKQQLIVLRRPRRRAPNLMVWDRFLFGAYQSLMKLQERRWLQTDGDLMYASPAQK